VRTIQLQLENTTYANINILMLAKKPNKKNENKTLGRQTKKNPKQKKTYNLTTKN